MDCNNELVDLLETCLTITNTQEEVEFLDDLITCLQSKGVENDLDDDDPETCFFREVVQRNPAPNYSLEQLQEYSGTVGLVWKVVEDLDWFLYYLFHRRYGWPDLKEESGYLLVSLPEAQGKFRKSKKSDELRYKTRIIELLDVLILWLFHQDANLTAIRMYTSAIRLASGAPVTRHQMVIHSLDWLKERLSEPPDDVYESLRDLIILSVTDVWSQIRSSATGRMGPVIDKFTLDQVQNIFEELAKNCEPFSNTWQSTDGSISALNTLIKRFQRVGYNIGEFSMSVSSTSPRIQSQIRFGRHVFDRLPSYILHKMKSLVFILVNNQQLTIRETVIKAFVNCLNRCNDHESELAFHDVYQRLQSKATCTAADVEYENLCPILNPSFAFMNPYTAESLLNLCLFLFKRIRDHQSYLENWDIYHNTFDIYLMHPASSVRLSTSNLYKYVVARSISNPLLVKNILHCLLRKWQPSQRTLLRSVVDLIRTSEADERRPSVTDYERAFEDEADTWEWREGRLLVYELVCQLLIKNHHLYTFGPRTLVGAIRAQKSSTSGCSPAFGMRPSSIVRPGSVGDTVRSSWDKTQSYSGQALRQAMGSNSAAPPVTNLSSSLSSSDPALHGIKLGWSSVYKEPEEYTEIDNYDEEFDSDTRRTSQQEAEIRAASLVKPKLPTMDSQTMTAVSAGNVLHHYEQFTTMETKNRCSSFLVHVKTIEAKEKDAEARSISSGVSNPQESASSRLPSFRSLLCQMFHTCSESLCDPQWELRRMAKQTFACLGELLRWFDPHLLAALVNTHLVCDPTLMTYACLCLLKDTLQHTARLQAMTRNPPETWQSEVAMTTIQSIIGCVHANLDQWLRSCRHYLQRLHFDCITPITAHVLMLAVIHFSAPKPVPLSGTLQVEEVDEESDASEPEHRPAPSPAVDGGDGDGDDYPRLSDVQSHVDTVVNMFLRLDSVLHQGTASDIPVYGFEIYPSITNVPSIGCSSLEFCLHFLEQLGEDLSAFLQCADILSCVQLLPLLVDWIRRLHRLRTDTTDCIKGLIASLGTLACKLVEKAKVDASFGDRVRVEIERLVEIVAGLIEEHVSRESWWLRQLMDITIQLLTVVETDLGGLIMAVIGRLRGDKSAGQKESAVSEVRNESNFRLFASQANHESVAHESDHSLDDSDEDEVVYPESLTLKRTRLESGTDGRLSSFAASISTEPGGSDWDSDSDDDRQNSLTASFRTTGNFLQKLARCQRDHFFEHIMNLNAEEQALVRTVISQSY